MSVWVWIPSIGGEYNTAIHLYRTKDSVSTIVNAVRAPDVLSDLGPTKVLISMTNGKLMDLKSGSTQLTVVIFFKQII